jgi:hypothetical protein
MELSILNTYCPLWCRKASWLSSVFYYRIILVLYWLTCIKNS